MARGSSLTFNILTVLLLVMTCLIGVCYLLVAVNPNFPLNPLKPAPLPTIMPTPAPTGTSLADVFPTALPPSATPTDTETPQPASSIASPTPSEPVSPTVANPTPPPLITHTPTAVASLTQAATATATRTATASGPTLTPTNTLSALPFTLQPGNPTYQPNFANTAGCNWMGIAGQAFDLSGRPVIGLIVHLTWPDGTQDSLTGSKPVYGAGGYEFFLTSQPIERQGVYHIQLLNSSGSPLSDSITVDTKSDCDKNLIKVNFVQNH
ncbi:MAG: hypothetical protein HY023_06760 [Chloroflexi bacterium]|nr:hypothetical protein [Chloroflexota bacterium]